jgi:hypothetical protein
MKLSKLKKILQTIDYVSFRLESGEAVPAHFHVTEVGVIDKHFIDCGGLVRRETAINFQLWNADDFEHRLDAGKMLRIIQLSEEKLGMKDGEIEVEYQRESIGKYGLEFDGAGFILTNKTTACLAEDACGIPSEKERRSLSDLIINQPSCTPNSGCC